MRLLDHLPILQILLPLLAAPLGLLWRHRPHAVWWLAMAAAGGGLVIAILLLAEQMAGAEAASYMLGGFARPLGIEYRIDAANAIILLILNAAALLALCFARPSIEKELPEKAQAYFYSCFLLCLGGLGGVAATGDVFNLFVFLEISSLSAYALIALGGARDGRAYVAAYNYLILGTLGATFYVLGVGFLYGATGTLNMVDLAERLPLLAESRSVEAGFALILTGLALKIAMFPLHMWLPSAYARAPSAAAIFLAAAATKTAIYALARILFSVFSPDYTFGQIILEGLVAPLACAGMIFASWAAWRQNEFKLMLAWSSIAQISYILLGISLETRIGLEAAFLHVFNHACQKGALFMGAGCLIWLTGKSTMAALANATPSARAAMTLATLSLVGVPLTSGFISKWALLAATLEVGWVWAVLAIIVSSLLGVAYGWRIISALWFAPAPTDAPPARALPRLMTIPLWLLALASIYFGLETSLPIGAASLTADHLIGINTP